MTSSHILALDYGTKKTGVAYAVEGFSFAWKTVKTSELKETIPQMIKEKNIWTVILGMPYNIDGSISEHAKRVQKFKVELEKIITVPVFLHDERLTSSIAEMSFEEDGIDGDIDAEAARLILASWLSSQSPSLS